MSFNTNLLQTNRWKNARNNLSWLYFQTLNSFLFPYFNSDILHFFIWCRMVFCNQFIFERFVPNIRLLLKTVPTKLFHCVDIILDSAKLSQSWISWLELYWLKHFIDLSCWFTLYLHMHVLGWCEFKCFVYPT